MQRYILHNMKSPANIGLRPTKEDYKILTALMKKLGGSSTSVIRQAIRVLAEKENVTA